MWYSRRRMSITIVELFLCAMLFISRIRTWKPGNNIIEGEHKRPSKNHDIDLSLKTFLAVTCILNLLVLSDGFPSLFIFVSHFCLDYSNWRVYVDTYVRSAHLLLNLSNEFLISVIVFSNLKFPFGFSLGLLFLCCDFLCCHSFQMC